MNLVAAPVDVALRDGATVRIRPMVTDDEPALRELLDGLSIQSRWLRFFSAGTDLHRAAAYMSALEPGRGRGLVAVAGDPERIVAHAAYVRETPQRAEVAFEVADDWHGRGIATVLLAHLSELATAEGIETFTAVVLPDNHLMIQVFRDSGFAVEVRSAPNQLEVELPAELGEEARARFDDRDRVAASAAVSHVLRPASVALIGVSNREGSVGAAVLRNLIKAGYRGDLSVVHPREDVVGGVPAHRSIGDVPGPPELAVIAVPAEAVVDVARECGAAGVRALVVLSAGFAEVGARGRERQSKLLAVCRASGMRLVGPNCLGVVNTAPDVALNASFAPVGAPPGSVAFASQSGAFGIAAIAEAARRGLGLSSFVSTGNKADLSGNDLLRFWEGDEATAVIGLYLESFGNPRRFGQIARRVTGEKPVIAVKSGRSAAGSRAATSHTGALLAASDSTVDALFRHAGVIRAGTVGELFDVAALLAGQPLPAGDRVGIVTNAGGPGIACADACEAATLRVEPLPTKTRRRLGRHLPREATTTNPVDMIASASADDYRRTLEALAADPSVDAVVAIFIPPLVTQAPDVADAIRSASVATRAAGKPLLAVWMAQDDAALATLAGGVGGVPAYGTPEEAIRALAHAARYAEWRRGGNEPHQPPAGIDSDAAAAAIAEVLAEGGGWLVPDRVAELLAAYGIPQVKATVAATPAAVADCAAELGGEVAVKAIAPGVLHKSDVGGVRLGVRGAPAAGQAARQIAAAVRGAGHQPVGFLVQTMAPEGVEMLVGVTSDPDWGPVVACAAGGTAVELLGDVQSRLAPLSRNDASDMLRSLRTFPLLDGYRGAPRADVGALEDIIVRVSTLAAAHPEIAELDCNPVLVGPGGATVVDARIRIAAPRPARPYPSLDR
ncbi:MAG TPA: GNAT family N-acetyltransferase [Solirubrobacteraceae bacterium]|nr:GNAT family N-acetyltransferase [Solirubrobacteraceae bacterium]